MSAKRKPSTASGAPALVPNSAEDFYAATFDQFATKILAHRPRGDALKVQLLHYLSDPIFTSNRDVISWALSGAMVSLLAHLTGGAHEKELHRTRHHGIAAWMPILRQLQEPLDKLILAHTATTGFGLTLSEPVFVRVKDWSMHDGRKFEAWTAAANKAARIQRQAAMPPLDDPLFPKTARIIIAELKELLAQLRNQPLTKQRPMELVSFFQRQAESHEFGFLNDPHNLRLWLQFVSHNPTVFHTQSKRPGAIFDLFQHSVSGHKLDYIRQKRSRG
jgi:hypothetical protein